MSSPRTGNAPRRVFLSSTCYDLEDFRALIRAEIEKLGYEVWASEAQGFPVHSGLHNHDNCLRNVEACDLYVLIINNRYGSTYDGTLYPKHPLREQPGKTVSVTWYEYLRALATNKDVLILVRSRVWDQRPVFREAKRQKQDWAGVAEELGLPEELFEFLDFVQQQERRNWIFHFRDLAHALEGIRAQLDDLRRESEREFIEDIRRLLELKNYRSFEDRVAPSGAQYFTAKSGSESQPDEVAVHCIFAPTGREVLYAALVPFVDEFRLKDFDFDKGRSVCEHAVRGGSARPAPDAAQL